MELYPGVYQIQSLFGGRNLFQYLFVGDNCVVVDTGISETPEKVIFPYMDRLGLAPTRLTLALTYRRVDRTTEADGQFRAVLELDPRNSVARAELTDLTPGHRELRKMRE